MAITAKPRGNVVRYYAGNDTQTLTKQNNIDHGWVSLMISNDSSTNNLIFSVNNITITIKAGETFDEDFVDFDQVIIEATDNYRIWLRE